VSDESARSVALIAWLEQRAEPAPASLRPRLADEVRATASAKGDGFADILTRAGERLLDRLLEHGCGHRSNASDLLAADALVTYAFEAAAESGSCGVSAIDASAARSMARIAALARTA
jgi:hypothetical protein